MKTKLFLGTVLISLLTLVNAAFAAWILDPSNPMNSISSKAMGYIWFIWIMVLCYWLVDRHFSKKMEEAGIDAKFGGPNLRAGIFAIVLIMMMISEYVDLPIGLITMGMSFIVLWGVTVLIINIYIYIEKYKKSPEVAEDEFLEDTKHRAGKKERRAMNAARGMEQEEKATIVKIFDLLKKGEILAYLRGALEQSKRSHVDIVKELKEVYTESSTAGANQKTIKDLETGEIAFKRAEKRLNKMKDTALSSEFTLLHQSARKISKKISDITARRMEIGENEEKVILELATIVRYGEKHTKNIMADMEDKKSEGYKSHAKQLEGLKELHHLLIKLAKELEVEMMWDAKVENYTSTRRERRTSEKAGEEGSKPSDTNEDEEIKDWD
ncbi:MAG: hypothetical protein ABIG20_02025 [archaeon]